MRHFEFVFKLAVLKVHLHACLRSSHGRTEISVPVRSEVMAQRKTSIYWTYQKAKGYHGNNDGTRSPLFLTFVSAEGIE